MPTPNGRIRKHAHIRHAVESPLPGEEIVSQVIGSRGLKNLGGRVQEEYDRLLTSWAEAVKFYIEMRDDITISTLMNAIKLPLLAAEFDVEAASDAEVDVAARDWLWDAMNNMHHQTWRSHVQDMLEAPEFGFAIAEIVLEKRSDGRLWIKNIDPRGQETLYRWEFDEFDHTVAFIQQDPDTGRIASIPMSKTVHVTFGGRKGNPQGRGMFRVLFRTWRFLKNIENLEGIGLERNVGGMPVATLPTEPLSSQDIDDLQAALRDLRMDEEMYLILPNGLTIAPYSGSINVTPLSLVINRKQQEILQLGFAQFIKLGMNQVGTQALVKGSQDFFTLGLESIQQMMLESWNGQLVPFLFQFNEFSFPGMTGMPKVTWATPGKVDIGSVLNSYNTAIQAQAMSPNSQDEEHFRGLLDLPDILELEDEPQDAVSQGVALNGIQISALQGIITAVSTKQIPGEAARVLIQSAFPLITADAIETMIRSAEAFTPASTEPTSAPSIPAPAFSEDDEDIEYHPGHPDQSVHDPKGGRGVSGGGVGLIPEKDAKAMLDSISKLPPIRIDEDPLQYQTRIGYKSVEKLYSGKSKEEIQDQIFGDRVMMKDRFAEASNSFKEEKDNEKLYDGWGTSSTNTKGGQQLQGAVAIIKEGSADRLIDDLDTMGIKSQLGAVKTQKVRSEAVARALTEEENFWKKKLGGPNGELTVYRGVNLPQDFPIGDQIVVNEMPVSSWTTNPLMAKNFGGTIIARKVKPKDIVGSFATRSLIDTEFEVMTYNAPEGVDALVVAKSGTPPKLIV